MILATILKDAQLLLRDRGALASMFVLPLAFITVFGFMFTDSDGGDGEKIASSQGGTSTRKQPLALWAPPGNERADQIVKELEEAPEFTIRRVQAKEDLDPMVSSREVAAALAIPPDYDPDQGPRLELIIDQALPDAERYAVQGPMVATVIGSYFRHKYGAFLKAAGDDPKLDGDRFLITRSPSGLRKKREYTSGFQVTVPSNSVLFCFFLCVAVGLSFVEERKLGTWRRILAAPVSRRFVLIAKLGPFFVIGLIQMVFLFAVGILAFGMDVSGSYGALVMVTVSLVISALGLGFLVASFGGSEKQVASITSIAVLIMGLVSGCMFPRFLMPEAFRKLSLLVPHGWALDAYRDVLVRDGTTMADMLLPSLVLVGFGALFALLGGLLFRFER
jgi:ABC-2 type transport system permease protein